MGRVTAYADRFSALRPPAEEDFTSPLRSAAVAARVGLWLGICFGLAFLTGLISHWAQEPDAWLPFPTRPTWGYRVTQGLHVVIGVAAIPLLLVKLWTVFPKLFARPPRGLRRVVLEVGERGSIGVLVGAAIFQLASGLANSAQWYPWDFRFRSTHYAMGWIAVGALALHIAIKLPVIRTALGEPVDSSTLDREGADPVASIAPGALDRRGLVRTALLAAGVAVIATAGSTVPLLRRISVLGVRSGDGPGGIPINKSARAADVVASALSPDYRLTVTFGANSRVFTREELAALRQTSRELPIACVEGWSASGRWSGVRLRDLLDLVEAPRERAVRITSLQQRGPYRATELPAQFADDPSTLLALTLDDEPLALDHGYPCRLIAPNRPGVLQTKWVTDVEVLA
ncbi:molybdopterin-dependent oxidoreductase [Nocardioides sp.]|uniref:molybdopterin-dependent oxidoreductase n=1 Tax=Nocardioides sp. TaxID=35761 RepID=UPI003511D44F